ncbi:response regulator [Flavobacterium selenitireducens]|uniref:response regulator n=1 Tax=Flavobacterium selenitireducens TaxID=2722704 RepID=UPI00168BCED2|nr:response regulator [Flavobacterium selenitireducens]MBD3583070.1 response regulator [Flavobacterium selenitireducens]
MTAKKKIILTDDDPGIQDAVRLIFERINYEVIVFTNGEPLLNDAFETPDLFILDKQLSGVDGLDICRYLKGRPQTAHVPILIISASMHIAKLARLAGAEAFVEKPFKMRAIRAVVERLLQTSESKKE